MSGGGGGGGPVKVGYWYSMGLHFGLCSGPVDALLAIDVGERRAWDGNLNSSTSIHINQPDLLGGEDREGGIQGTFDLMMGAASQTPSAYLTAVQGAPQPAYRGVVTAVYRGRVAARNPYLKPWAFLVRSTFTVTPWYTARVQVDVGSGLAMNPAHIIYACLTNADWGLGYAAGMIDDVSFRAAADVFHAEGLGLCLAWQQQDSITNFVQMVSDHAGAVVGQDRRTGLFVLRPIRGGYSVPALPLFNASNVLDLESLQRPGIAEMTNEVTVTYTDLATGGKTASVVAHNLAAIQSQGGVVSATRGYPGLPTAALAARVAERELRVLSTPLAKVRLKVNRDAWALLPGDLIRLTWPPLGIADMPLRVLAVDWGSLREGAIGLELAEDVFGLPATSYAAQQPMMWQEPSLIAHPAPAWHAWEAPYVDLVRSYGPVGIPIGACHVATAAARPPALATHYELQTRIGTEAWRGAGRGDWVPNGTLVNAISAGVTLLNLNNVQRLDVVAVGMAALLGNEIVRVVAVDPALSLLTVARGCADTTPTPWPAGTRVWVPGVWGAADRREYAPSETVSTRFITVTSAQRLADASAPTANVTMTQRQHRPYAPGLLRINGQAWPASLSGALTVTWAHRDRIIQSDQLIDEAAASIGPEAGTTYTLRLINHGTGALIQEWTGLTGTSQAMPAVTGPLTLRVELWSVRGGLASHQQQRHVFSYT